jgi:hypothetical protein
MGYFDVLASNSFKKDNKGNTIFFPWGRFRKGRVLPDEATETKLRGILRRYYQVTLLISTGVGTIFGWVWLLLLASIFFAWFYLSTKPLISGCPYSDDKLTTMEIYANTAAGLSSATLWFFFIFSILFVIAGILIAATEKSIAGLAVGFLFFALFGACSVVIGYMLKVKRNT